MPRWRDKEFQDDLNRLLRRAREGRGQLPPLAEGTHELRRDVLFRYRSALGTGYLLDAEAQALRRALQRKLAGRSRQDLGLSGAEAAALLQQACNDAVTGTIKGAVASLIAAVEAPIDSWVVAEPVQIFLPCESLQVGRSTYTSRIPRLVASRATLHLAQEHLVPPIAFVRVQARGQETARILAAERIAESGAILDLIDRPNLNAVAGETMLVRRCDGRGGISFARSAWIVNDVFVSNGRLNPPYRQLSRAANKEESNRSDWERRVLASTRWLSRSLRSTWPADRLAGLMIALECLFVAGRRERGKKGDLIAERLSERFKLNEMTVDEQAAWLADLYQRRNDAVHEGREFLDDLDVDRLSELTHFVIRSMSVHLIAGHRYPRHSCRTFDEAMRCSRRRAASP